MFSSVETRIALPFITPNKPTGTLLLYLNNELKSIGVDPRAVLQIRKLRGQKRELKKKLSNGEDVKKELEKVSQELKKIEEEEKERAFVKVITIPGEMVIITTVNKPYLELLKPNGIDEKLWKSFLAYVANKYGVTNIERGILEEYEKFMRDKVIEVSKIFGIKIGERWVYDPSKLPKDLAVYFDNGSNKESD